MFATLPQGLEAVCPIDNRIRITPDGHEAESFTFAELRARALGVLYWLQERGLRRGDELVMCLQNNAAFVDAFWACQLGGIIPVPVSSGMTEDQRARLFGVFRQLNRPYLYTDHPTGSRIRALADKLNLDDEYRRLKSRTILVENITGLDQHGRPASTGPGDVAFIQFSSGSTGNPKGVVLTHENLAVNIQDIHAATRLTDDDRSLSWMPLTHDMGLIGFHLAMLLRGLDHTIMSTDAFLRRPTLWLQAASRERSTLLCSPNFGYRLFLKAFARWPVDDLDLGRVRMIFNGAEPVSVRVCEEFLSTLFPFGLSYSAMAPVYGLAEATVAVSLPEPGERYRRISVSRASLGLGESVVETRGGDAVEIVSVGRPVEHCQVRISDGRGRILRDGQVGRIEVRGPNVMRGYYGDRIDEEGEGGDRWFDTGDVGFVRAGSLFITGRLKDILFVNGQNFYAHDLEDLACAARGVDHGKVAVCGVADAGGGSESVAVFIVHHGGIESFAAVVSEVRRILGERAGVEARAVVPVPAVPRTTSGKIKRYALRLAFEAGEFDAQLEALSHIAPQERADEDGHETGLESRLLEICAPALGNVRLHRHDNFFEIGMNSLKLVEIHELIDRHFPSQLEVSDIFDHPTLAQLAAFLDSKRCGESA
jgi:acyl-CoA synthetase (AMP-forming)/AMP-acid ligase II